MTTYAWPNTRAFTPQLAELRVVDSLQRVHESPLSGYTQTQSMPGARWGWSYAFGDQVSAERQALEAYLLRLSGREHRVQLWDHKHPRPAGNIALSGVTMGATAAQFATSLTLAGCRADGSALLGGSFEVDANADGVCEPWQRYQAGSRSGLSALRSAGGTDGSYCQLTSATMLGASSSDQQGVWQSGMPVSALVGQTVTMSVQAYGSGGQGRALVEWLDAGASVVGTLSATQALSGAWTTIAATGVVPVGAVTASVYLFQHSAGGGPHFAFWDAAQLRAAATALPFAGPATLLAGDWVGLAGGQLVRVVATATANDAGAMTVEVRHMLRAAVASGSAVTLDRPTALFVRAESGLALQRQPGQYEPGMAVDFVEVFA